MCWSYGKLYICFYFLTIIILFAVSRAILQSSPLCDGENGNKSWGKTMKMYMILCNNTCNVRVHSIHHFRTIQFNTFYCEMCLENTCSIHIREMLCRLEKAANEFYVLFSKANFVTILTENRRLTVYKLRIFSLIAVKYHHICYHNESISRWNGIWTYKT